MPHVKSVTGLGMMIGVELDGLDAKEVLAKCRDKGVLFLTAKTKIRMLPPLIMTTSEIQEGMKVLQSVLEEM
jgi:acetylornithine/N-succinyldiaminopimelate aminotransferase